MTNPPTDSAQPHVPEDISDKRRGVCLLLIAAVAAIFVATFLPVIGSRFEAADPGTSEARSLQVALVIGLGFAFVITVCIAWSAKILTRGETRSEPWKLFVLRWLPPLLLIVGLLTIVAALVDNPPVPVTLLGNMQFAMGAISFNFLRPIIVRLARAIGESNLGRRFAMLAPIQLTTVGTMLVVLAIIAFFIPVLDPFRSWIVRIVIACLIFLWIERLWKLWSRLRTAGS